MNNNKVLGKTLKELLDDNTTDDIKGLFFGDEKKYQEFIKRMFDYLDSFNNRDIHN